MKSLESKPQIVAIASIIVGKRHRRDLGDIAALAQTITEFGYLLHPIPIRPDGMLISGVRWLVCFQVFERL
jgi:ParB family chromosome partitioning protein